jgi:hypothetical protein
MDRPRIDITELGSRWWAPSVTEADQLVAELRSEMPMDHRYANETVEPVAVKKLMKDVVLWLPDREQWAAVHLTYNPETDPRWPTFTVADSWSDLLADIL